MPNQPNFPIPSVISPEKTRCIQLEIPDNEDWIRVFVGLLAQPSYWFNWQRTGDTQGAQCAAVWTPLFEAIDWSDMSCCCNDAQPVIYRYGPDGQYERSTDGGATWQDASSYLYSNTSTKWPDPNDLGIATTKCQAADGVVQTIKNQIIADISDGSTAAAILAIVAACLIAFLDAATVGALTAAAPAIGAAIVTFGVAAMQAAFTSTVWSDFLCEVYCNMDTNTSINEAGLEALLSAINSHFTGIVVPVLYSIVKAAGVVGLTNMMRSGAGSVDADCSACCPDCATLWSIFGDDPTHFHGTINSRGAGFVIASSGSGGYLLIRTPDKDQCCVISSVEFIGSAPAVTTSWTDCGNNPSEGAPQHTGIYGYGSVCVNYFQLQSFATFTVKITFADCP